MVFRTLLHFRGEEGFTWGNAMDNDLQLYRQFCGGSDQALAHLVRRHQPALLGFIQKRLDCPQDSWDVLQQIWLCVLRKQPISHSPGQAPEQRFQAWLYCIARNQISNHIRHLRRHRQPFTGWDEAEHLAATQLTLEDPAFQATARQHTQRVLQSRIKQLPAKQGNTLRLKLFYERTLEEVADTMDCALGTSKAHYHAALKAMKHSLDRDSALAA